MPFITDDTLKAVLAANLRTTTAKVDEAGVWAQTIADSNLAAQQDVAGRLAARGYSAAQIAAWDRLAEFNKDIGLFWCLVKGAGLHGNDPTFINKLDRRAELDAVEVLTGGVVVDPDTAAAGVVGYGALDTDGDAFTRDTTW